MQILKILLVGPFPAPVGGVSIHLDRLSKILSENLKIDKIDESSSIKNEIYNVRSLNPITYFQKINSADVVHIHSGNRLLKYFHLIISKILGKKIVLTIHSYRKGKFGGIYLLFDRLMYSLPNITIVVNKNISDYLQLKNKTIVMNAFLPPVMSEEMELPVELQSWIKKKKEDGFHITIANASRLEIFCNEDLYGLDLCIDAALYFKKKNTKICFVFIVSAENGGIDIGYYRNIIESNNLTDCFYLLPGSISFVNLMLATDSVLRPTNTDGDSLTVREALLFGKNVIASDVVARPKGTILFKNREVESLIGKLELIMENPASKINKFNETGILEENIKFYNKFYYELYNKMT